MSQLRWNKESSFLHIASPERFSQNRIDERVFNRLIISVQHEEVVDVDTLNEVTFPHEGGHWILWLLEEYLTGAILLPSDTTRSMDSLLDFVECNQQNYSHR